ncbi:FG-GAP-like repeat-containing protein [Luteitalea sp.]|jgi:tetratricopeptide (TPR) repeat protein|uniref:FG-GAP-like repeat-containing protein n=1 Tax=Luteitalea sp. TaxID=2004800 RepID=UPI0037C53E85
MAIAPLASQPQERPAVFQPPLATPEALVPFLDHLEPGRDAFPLERDAERIEARLAEVGAWLASGRPGQPPTGLFAPGFRGGRLRADAPPASSPRAPIAVRRMVVDAAPRNDAAAIADDLRSLVDGARHVRVTEFLVTGIAPVAGGNDVRTDVRFEIVSEGAAGARQAHVGTWRQVWRRQGEAWQVVEWVAATHTVTRAATPLFAEITTRVIDQATPVARQFAVPLDTWMSRLDSVLTRDSNGHHGVSVGDADGDGLEDLYVAQPSGLPNRLLRNRGDGTFEDITDASGAGLLDDTAQSLFADVDNDGDQDLVLATSLQPLLLRNDGKGRFEIVGDAFTFAAPLQGVLTGVTMADYDRDGFLDAYLCVYSYFFGAGEDKAGTPMPYHDARNGPPGVLFRNDGTGRFVEATKDTGLDVGNDRYHFAGAWADVDEDGWPDLLVANDFGTKNLYRNLGRQGGRVRFEDVAAKAGVLDHGAGMSASFVDYDNDGRLDIFTGNMWAAAGQRVTASPAFMPEAPAEVRDAYRRHARGNGLFRNKGDGTFDDRSIEAGVTMGRWAWSSDALDIDSDGWQDLYVANGMLSRGDQDRDLESYFWRQVVARSPLTRITGGPYDDAWRAINSRLVRGSIASRQRNVLYRNTGAGSFDDVSGVTGLDLDQDGRSFATLDLDRDGDADLAVMAARQAPHLRIFRNDHPARSVIALTLQGTRSNRDAIGARVDVEADGVRATRLVQAGSGFLSQHSREVLVGLGASRAIKKVVVTWPSGLKQEFTDVAVDARYRLVEGGTLERFPLVRGTAAPAAMPAPATATPPTATWFYRPVPAPDFSATDLGGTTRSLAALKGRPALLLLWRADAPSSVQALASLGRARGQMEAAGIATLAIALDPQEAAARVAAAAPAGVPVVHASRDLALTWAIAWRHLFMNRPPVPLPAAVLIDASGAIVRAWRDVVAVEAVLRDAGVMDAPDPIRLARALPFEGRFHAAIPARNWLPYGSTLLDQGLEAEAIVAFERASQSNPSAAVLYRLGTLLAKRGQGARARQAFEAALALDPKLAEAHNDLGTLIAQDGDLPGAVARFRQALAATPDYPDALNNLGYALLLGGQPDEARALYEKALQLQPDFPEALNNLGLIAGRAGDLPTAERRFREALQRRPAYGEAANNLALALVAQGRAGEAVTLLEDLVARMPSFEDAYVTLAKIHLSAGQTTEGLRAVQRLLQRNPTHPLGMALLREYGPR